MTLLEDEETSTAYGIFSRNTFLNVRPMDNGGTQSAKDDLADFNNHKRDPVLMVKSGDDGRTSFKKNLPNPGIVTEALNSKQFWSDMLVMEDEVL
jgi:hypothetical protein